MGKKQEYFTPELTMVEFSVEDIITTSAGESTGGNGSGHGGGVVLPDDNW